QLLVGLGCSSRVALTSRDPTLFEQRLRVFARLPSIDRFARTRCGVRDIRRWVYGGITRRLDVRFCVGSHAVGDTHRPTFARGQSSNRHRAVRPLNLHRPTTHADLDVLCRFTPRRLLVFHVDAEASTRYSHDDPRRLNVELSLGVVDDIAL